MITRTDKIRQTPDWQQALANAIHDIDELLDLLGLDHHSIAVSQAAQRQFSLKITREYAARMRPGNPSDPLLRQVLPVPAETQLCTGFSEDPVGDHDAHRAQGVLHKYAGRVLLLTTGACAIHCRYCFRRHFPYAEANAARSDWQQALHYLQQSADITEVILSGGDPLTLSDTRLATLVEKLAQIRHITTLRIHTRLPVVLPQRVCDELLQWLRTTRLQVVLVIHCNHAQEIDEAVREALAKLRDAGVTLLNQSVLLKGVNDNSHTLIDLSRGLFDAGVLPYYLHCLDAVSGAAHFEVSESDARTIIKELQRHLPGYLVPKLVREIAGKDSKTPIQMFLD